MSYEISYRDSTVSDRQDPDERRKVSVVRDSTDYGYIFIVVKMKLK